MRKAKAGLLLGFDTGMLGVIPMLLQGFDSYANQSAFFC